MAKVVIGLAQENPVVNTPNGVISSPGITLPRYRHQIANVTAVTITRAQHNVVRVTSVTVTDLQGEVYWIDTTINPETGDVSIHADVPITGYVLID
jgi:hypothetical protein